MKYLFLQQNPAPTTLNIHTRSKCLCFPPGDQVLQDSWGIYSTGCVQVLTEA